MYKSNINSKQFEKRKVYANDRTFPRNQWFLKRKHRNWVIWNTTKPGVFWNLGTTSYRFDRVLYEKSWYSKDKILAPLTQKRWQVHCAVLTWIREVKQRRQRRQWERRKSNKSKTAYLQNNNFARASRFFVACEYSRLSSLQVQAQVTQAHCVTYGFHSMSKYREHRAKFRSGNLLESGNKNRWNLPCGELLLSLTCTRSFEKNSLLHLYYTM